jgi:hypothetical protein
MRRIPKNARTIIVLLAAALLLMQIFWVEKSNPPIKSDIVADKDIKPILHRACYDCHSNATEWPWYSFVAPASWLIARDVREGRQHLNFSEWESYDLKTRSRRLESIAEEVKESEMPPWYYTMMHGEARLTLADRGQIWAWAITESERIRK